jgi:hypothetical protein
MPRDTAYHDLRPPALTLRAASGLFHAVPLSMPSRCTFVLRRICGWRRRCCSRGVTRPYRHFACPLRASATWLGHGWTSVMRSFRHARIEFGVWRGAPAYNFLLGHCFRRRAASDEAQRRACACCSNTWSIAMSTVCYYNETICQPS